MARKPKICLYNFEFMANHSIISYIKLLSLIKLIKRGMNHEEGIKGGMNDYIAKRIKREIVYAVI